MGQERYRSRLTGAARGLVLLAVLVAAGARGDETGPRLQPAGLVASDTEGTPVAGRAAERQHRLVANSPGAPLPGMGAVPFVHEARLEGRPAPGPGQAYAYLGLHVAVSGNTMVVGAPLENTPGGENAGAAYVFVRSGSTWTLEQRLTASDPTGHAGFGAPVAVNGDTVLVGAQGANTSSGMLTGAAYVFVRSGTTWTEQQKLAGSGLTPNDYFGYSVSVSGDTAIVSAEHAATPPGGAAWVFVRSGTTWTEQQKLTASDGAPGDYFVNVAISGDTIVVGADSDNTPAGGTNAGSAYVFVRSGTTWTEVQHLTASDGAPDDQFGWSVDIDADTIVVGAVEDDGPGGANQGSAYVFVRSGSLWSEQQKLVAPDGAANDELAESVAISGDTIVAGAQGRETVAGADAGSAYVFARAGTTWTLEQNLMGSDGDSGDFFGADVAVSANTIVVGAPGADPTPAVMDGGKAYAFERSGTAWGEQQVLVGSMPPGGDLFGSAVSVFGDTAIAGAIGEDLVQGSDAGAAYVFVRSGGTWIEQQRLIAGDPFTGYLFGQSVALFGDTAIVGAPQTSTADGAGAAYVFVRSGNTWSWQASLAASPLVPSGGFGTAVSVFQDTAVVGAAPSSTAYAFTRSGTSWTFRQRVIPMDGAPADAFGASLVVDGDTLFIGSPLHDLPGGPDAGAVYVFEWWMGVAWLQRQKLQASNPSAAAEFGRSLSVSGDTLVVGAPGGAGSAYVFTRTGTLWTEQQRLSASDGAAGDQFGEAVAATGNIALVGASSDDNEVGPDAGAAYVFFRSGTRWSEVQKLLAPDATTGDGFGRSVSLSGGTALVGEPTDDTSNGEDAGAAHVFRTAQTAADLGVTLDDAPDPVGGLDPLTYTIGVENLGPDPAALVTLSMALPAAVTFQSASGAGWSCAYGGGSVNCTRPSLDVGQAPAVIIVVTAPATGGPITSVAHVAHVGLDPLTANDTASEDTDVTQAEADLAVTQTDAPDPVRAESTLTYTIDVANLGPSNTSGMTLTDTLPAGATFLSSIPGSSTCTHMSGTLTCALGALAPSAHHSVTVTVIVSPATLGAIVNTVTVDGEEPDPIMTNNDATESTLVVVRSEGELSHGTSLLADLASLGGAADQDLYAIRQEAHASYEVVIDGTSGDIGQDQGPELERLAADGTTVIQSSVPSGLGHSRSLRWIHTTGAEDGYVRVRSLSCQSDCAADDVYRIRAWETTYRVPRFNNNGSQVTVLLAHNTSGEPVSGRIAFWNSSGGLLHEEVFQLLPKALLALSTASVPALQGASGSITVSHDGPHGALSGKVVAVEPATGFAFDSPLEARIR
jgi:uncharacterized repeat protein (TIGR01451 family)